MDEFALIERYFAPLAGAEGLRLRDDAALLVPPPGCELVLTTDALVEGLHVPHGESGRHMARKLLRRNLSDLAAKGAEPLGYLLSLMLPPVGPEWLADFAGGLAEDQAEFGWALWGGDTTRSPAGVQAVVTAIGSVPAGQMLRRSGARPGEVLAVSGTLGDAALGLPLALAGEKGFLVQRYRLPQPRLALGLALRGRATACMDISDGLLGDAAHLARASGVRLVVEAGRLPLSAEARGCEGALQAALGGGDDYELLFTAPQGALAGLEGVTVIGRVEAGEGVELQGADWPERRGWQAF